MRLEYRAIRGEAEDKTAQSVPGDGTRPITDRAKEALFSIIGDWIEGVRVLDLFGGTGAVGIEALSRGASYAHFIDMNRKACETILANLKQCRLENRARVQRANSFSVLETLHWRPVRLHLHRAAAIQGSVAKGVAPDRQPARVAGPVRDWSSFRSTRAKDDPVDLAHLEEYDRREYGSVLLIFYAAAEDLAADIDVEETDVEEENADEGSVFIEGTNVEEIEAE